MRKRRGHVKVMDLELTPSKALHMYAQDTKGPEYQYLTSGVCRRSTFGKAIAKMKTVFGFQIIYISIKYSLSMVACNIEALRFFVVILLVHDASCLPFSIDCVRE